MKTLKILTFMMILLMPSCNLLQALHETNPDYNHPVIFSDAWHSERDSKNKQ